MKEDTVAKYVEGAPILTDDMTRVDFNNPKSAVSGYGLINLLSPTKLIEISMEGWRNTARLTRETDNPGDIYDWTGLSPEERAEGEALLKKSVDERIAEMEKHKDAQGMQMRAFQP
jgi:hypothetical protein